MRGLPDRLQWDSCKFAPSNRRSSDEPRPRRCLDCAMRRRSFLAAGAVASTGCTSLAVAPAAWAAALQPLGSPGKFDYAWLKGAARDLAHRPYQPHGSALPRDVAALDYDQYQTIRFRPDHALWADDRLRFRIRLFHLGLFFKRPVRMFELAGGQAQELAYDPAM